VTIFSALVNYFSAANKDLFVIKWTVSPGLKLDAAHLYTENYGNKLIIDGEIWELDTEYNITCELLLNDTEYVINTNTI